MDKNNITFLIICIMIILGTVVVYKYNTNKYATQSTMMVVPMEETQNIESNIVTTTLPKETTNQNITYKIITSEITTSIPTETIISETDKKIEITNNKDIKKSTTKNIIKESNITEIKMTSEKVEPTFPISLNSITVDELQYIKGIGEVTAQKIIDYRNSIGYFTSRKQLLEINGIGENKMNIIMEYTYIENEILEEYTEPENIVDIDEENPVIEEDNTIVEEDNSVIEEENIYPVNLNTASLEDLMTIPQITPEIAQEIINLRDSIQYYSNEYELLYINGISEKYLSDIMEYITVE